MIQLLFFSWPLKALQDVFALNDEVFCFFWLLEQQSPQLNTLFAVLSLDVDLDDLFNWYEHSLSSLFFRVDVDFWIRGQYAIVCNSLVGKSDDDVNGWVVAWEFFETDDGIFEKFLSFNSFKLDSCQFA